MQAGPTGDIDSPGLVSSNASWLRILIEQQPCAVAMVDAEMRYLAVSRRWLEDYEIDVPAFGSSYCEVFCGRVGHWKVDFQRALAGETVQADTERIVRNDGTVQ